MHGLHPKEGGVTFGILGAIVVAFALAAAGTVSHAWRDAERVTGRGGWRLSGVGFSTKSLVILEFTAGRRYGPVQVNWGLREFDPVEWCAALPPPPAIAARRSRRAAVAAPPPRARDSRTGGRY